MLCARYASLVFLGAILAPAVASAQFATPVMFGATRYAAPAADSSTGEGRGPTAAMTTVPGKTPGTAVEQQEKKDTQTRVAATTLYDGPVRPFSKLGIAVNVSTIGFGFEAATPLSRSFNLRGGASFIGLSEGLTEDGIDYDGELHFRAGRAGVDWFPFHGGFHVSAGVLILNSELSATASVKGGGSFTLDDVAYTSSVTDPVHGSAKLEFGREVSPTFTVGWGNIVPRSGKHFSVPFEIGMAYIGQSQVTINLAGTACQAQGCFNAATDPTTQANLVQEQNQLNDDLKGIQVFPIVSLGLSYKF